MLLQHRTTCRILGALLTALPMLCWAEPSRFMLLPTTTLSFQTQSGQSANAEAELATTPQSRAQGLMYRERMPVNHGMLFVFETYASCFWMRNTPLPLSIAFIDAQGIVTRIADMQPLSDAEHCPAQPSPYALEMHQGWFERNGIAPGDRVSGLPAQQAALPQP